jgi:tetratricopeptide (TPR) repeat protein
LKKLPDYREKQRILYINKRFDKDLIALGDRYLEAGRLSDAADFYQKANYLSGLGKIKEMAEAAGDIMIYHHVLKAIKQNVADDDWSRIGQRALEVKKYTFALHAFNKSNNSDKIDQVRKMMISEDQGKTS